MKVTPSNSYDIAAYIRANPVMVLGTIGADGRPHAAPVYVCQTSAQQLYFITKTKTQKFQDILHQPQVSVTIVNPNENSALQASGKAEVVNEPQLIELVIGKITEIQAKGPDWLPPLAKLQAGPYQIVGIKLDFARLANFLGAPAGGSHIFKTQE